VRWFPENISTYGGDIDGLFYLIYYIVGAWFVLTEVAILYFVIRYRRRPGHRARYVRGESLGQVAWILVPAFVVLLLDLGIDAAGARVWNVVKGGVPPTDLHVRLVAKQFNWDVTYRGPDAAFGTPDDVTLENALHVPVGRPVRLTLASRDVIHSFFLPHARLKQDVLPGREIDVWFTPTRTGSWEIACAELCGFGHYTMKGMLTVHSAADYATWEREQWPAG
jgi:cytochrome c oxidase subunit 2